MKSNVKKMVPLPSLILMIVGGEMRQKRMEEAQHVGNLPNILQSKTVGELRTEFGLIGSSLDVRFHCSTPK